jgi:hypothetical protein
LHDGNDCEKVTDRFPEAWFVDENVPLMLIVVGPDVLRLNEVPLNDSGVL